MIELNIITAFLTSLISLMIARKDYINHFLENLVFSKKLILLLTVSSGLTIIANRKSYRKQLYSPKFPSLSNIVFVLLIYNNLEKKVKRY